MITGKHKVTIKAEKKPRISVNKLAEYLEANPSRRKRIVMDAKYPESFITTRYKDAREIAKSYISGEVDEDYVLKEIAKFEKAAIAAGKIPDNDFKIQDNNLSADMLGLLLETELPDLAGTSVSSYQEPNKLIFVKGVSISVYPDLVIKKKIGNVLNVGCIKLSITKSTQLTDESQKIVAVMLHAYSKKHVISADKNEVVNNKFCLSMDIFKQQFVICPPSVKLRLKKVEDACEEIALWWSSL